METTTSAIGSLVTITAGLFFSLMLALMFEELIFGALFRFFFGAKPQPVQEEASRAAARTPRK